MKQFLKGRKTHIIATLMVLVGVVNLVIGDISLVEFAGSKDLHLVLEGLGFSTVRAGIAKVES